MKCDRCGKTGGIESYGLVARPRSPRFEGYKVIGVWCGHCWWSGGKGWRLHRGHGYCWYTVEE